MDNNEEYWKVPLTEKQKKQLDTDMIDEINMKYENRIDEETVLPERRWVRKAITITVVITIIVYLALILNSWIGLINLPTYDFLYRSFELSKEEYIIELQKAVVTVSAENSQGTGFNVLPDGLIITNYHIVEDVDAIHVRFQGGKTYKGEMIKSIPEKDIAFINIEGNQLPVLELEQDITTTTGDDVLIVGNPMGFLRIVTEGEIVDYIRFKNIAHEVIMIKGHIYKGNSGSPVFNQQNRVVGVIFGLVNMKEEGTENFGLALPIDAIIDDINTLLK